jgi:peptidoglycan/LPS O-acetylase OafA/YrhL
MIEPCAADVFQPFRMSIVWPVVVGGLAFCAFAIVVHWLTGKWTRYHATLAGITGLAAAVVATSISNRWDGGQWYWLAFTVGLTISSIIILSTCIWLFAQATND